MALSNKFGKYTYFYQSKLFHLYRHRQLALGNCLTALNEGKKIADLFNYLSVFYLELATLYKQCPGDREIEEYVKRIHALRQRMVEASIHVKIIEVITQFLLKAIYSFRFI
jgi:hypothetical protein